MQPEIRSSVGVSVDSGLRAYMSQIYNRMTMGVLVTALTAWFVASTPALMQALLGVGASRLVMIVAVPLQWLVFLPVSYLLGPVFAMGLLSIWIAMGVYRLLQTAIFTIAWQRGGWQTIKV